MTLHYLDLLKTFLGGALLVLLSACSISYIEIDNGDDIIRVNVEIADDSNEWAKGLMFRESLEEDEGMFFIFEDSKERTFWMKNTIIPLDIIFISEDNKILNILEAEPCKKDPWETYSSIGDAKYVFEVNKGFSRIKNIKKGDKVELR